MTNTKKILVAMMMAALSGAAFAQTNAEVQACNKSAIDKNGKPLTGAARGSYISRCIRGAKGEHQTACEARAVGSDGKPLQGAAKNAFVNKCLTAPVTK